MLLVRVIKKPSPIQGIGLFTLEPIPCGTKVWELTPGFDLILSEQQLALLSPISQEQVLTYAYLDLQTGNYVLCSDDGRFINHSPNPNLHSTITACYAIRDIAAGEELTEDYFSYDGLAIRKTAPESLLTPAPNSQLG